MWGKDVHALETDLADVAGQACQSAPPTARWPHQHQVALHGVYGIELIWPQMALQGYMDLVSYGRKWPQIVPHAGIHSLGSQSGLCVIAEG